MGNSTQQPTEPQQLLSPVVQATPAPAPAVGPVALTFAAVAERVSFPEEERKTLKLWETMDAFQRGVRESADRKKFVFYDGPPFATGLPHYGHILAGTIKDVICRYAHQTGHFVERRFGWDCHGLPIEYEIEKQRQIKTRQDVLDWGIANYNEACRAIVLRYTGEWRQVVTRFGRWIDFDNDYKTMDKNFMESVWWVFKQLFQKDLVYRAFKVMPYSTALATPLANFEVNQTAMDVSDPSVIVQFVLTGQTTEASAGGKHLPLAALVWTTTPWTLPSNLALALNPDLTYLVVQHNDTRFLLLKDRLDWVKTKLKWATNFAILDELPGSAFTDLTYKPLFGYFEETASPRAFRTVGATYVTATDGTGIVHQAPAFGEDDYATCISRQIISRDGSDMPCPLDANGRFTAAVADYAGMYIKDADKLIIRDLKSRGVMLLSESQVHSVKACPRSDTPLIYRAVPSWFIKVEGHNDQLVATNEQIRWVPNHVKDGRFKNWLADAKDWCVSRNRFWGTPIPLWANADFSEIKCIGSVAELLQLGRRLVRDADGSTQLLPLADVADIHRHFIDDIVIPSEVQSGEYLRRIDEVFDCWFESGSMPYGQVHYPFAQQTPGDLAPASFIAEGLDQTRGWFYTLHVLSTHLFGRPAFENVIVNGLVLAADGKKMSKRLKNYPDPQEVCERHGADAVRLYMCNSPVVRAEPLRFKEDGVKEVVRDVFRPYYNSYRFLVQEVTRLEHFRKFGLLELGSVDGLNAMDRWMLARSNSLVAHVRTELDNYRLYSVAPRLVKCLDDLTNWYIKTNRDRMRVIGGEPGEIAEAMVSLNVLYQVLLNITVLLAPFTPFITELVYQNLKAALPTAQQEASVHYVPIPPVDSSLLNGDIERSIERMQKIIETGRQMRDKHKCSLKSPVRQVIINAPLDWIADLQPLTAYIQDELNCVEPLVFSPDLSAVAVSLVPNWKLLGERLGPQMKLLPPLLKNLTSDQIRAFEVSQQLTLTLGSDVVVLTADELVLSRAFVPPTSQTAPSTTATSFVEAALVTIDFARDAELEAIAVTREIKSKVQRLRKACGVTLLDPVQAWIVLSDASPKTQAIVAAKKDELKKLLNNRSLRVWPAAGLPVVLGQDVLELDCVEEKVTIMLTVQQCQVDSVALQTLVSQSTLPAEDHVAAVEALILWIHAWPAGAVVPAAATLSLQSGHQVTVRRDEHYHL